MRGQKRPSTGLRDHEFPKPQSSNLISFCVQAVSLMEGNPSHGSTARGSAAETEAPAFEYEQGCFKGMKANPTEGF
jgi:hypothetical protein